MPFKKRASIVDDEDLKDFDSFLNQSESSDEEFSNTKSKAILQQARLQAEISLQKREEEEKSLQEPQDSYNSDDLDKRLSKYIGTYELPKAKIEEEEEEQEEKIKGEKGGGSDSEDFEEYKKRLGLNLEYEDDEEEKGGYKKAYTDSEGSMRDSRGSVRDSRGSLGEIKGYKERWEDSEGESEKEKREEGEAKKKEEEKGGGKKEEKEEIISDQETDYEKKIDWESDEGEKSDTGDRKEYAQDTIIKVESTKILPSSYKSDEVKSPQAEIPEQSKPLTFAEFQRRRSENRAVDSVTDKIASPNPPFSSPVVSSPHPDPPPPQPTPRPVLASNFLTPTSPQFSSPTLSLSSPPHSPRHALASHGPMSSPAPRAPLVDPPVSPLPPAGNSLALAGNPPSPLPHAGALAGNPLSLAGNPSSLAGNPLSLVGIPPSLTGNPLALAGNARAITPELKSLDEYEREYESGGPGSARPGSARPGSARLGSARPSSAGPAQDSLQADARAGPKASLQSFSQGNVQNRQEDFGREEIEIESDDDNNSYINNNNSYNRNNNANTNQNQKTNVTNHVNNTKNDVKTQQQRFDEMQQQYEEQQRLQQENLDRLQQQYKEQQQQLKKLQQSKPSVARSKPSAASSKPPAKPPAKPQAVTFKSQNQNQNAGKFGKPPAPPKPSQIANGKPRSNSLPKPTESHSAIDEKATHKIIEDSFSKFIQIFQEKAAMATPPRLSTPLNVSQLDTSTHQYPTYVSNDTEWKNKEIQMQKEIEELAKENRMLSGSLEMKDRKLKEKEEEIGALAQSNAVLSTRLQTSDMREKVKVTGLAALTPEEQRQLQQELKELETLVAGYQKENERLCADLKTAQQALKAADIRFVKDTQHMQAEIRSLQDASHPSSGSNDREMHVLREQLAIAQRRAAVVEDQAREREAELREQIDKLRKEKRELEAKFGGVDLTQLQKDSTIILTLENKIKALNAQHKEREEELQKKIQWYVDNQALLTQNDALIASQKALIFDLQAKLEQQSNMQKTLPSRANDAKRIKELEKKIAELENKKGGASNIESLISAVHPENELVNNLKNALAAQSSAHAEREAELDKGLRALRQEYDRMKQQFEKRIKELTASGTKAPKAVDVEAQIQAVRNHYQTKLKELQRKNALKPKPTKNTPPQPPTQPPTHPSTLLAHPLAQPPAHPLAQPPTHPLAQSHIPARTTATQPSTSIPSSPPKKAIDHEKADKIRQLEADLAHKNEEIRVLNYKLMSSNKGDYPPNEIVFSLQQQLATLRIECDTAKMQLQQADIARAAIMENAAAMVKQAQQTNSLQQGEIQLSLARAEGEASALRSRLSHLDAELNTYKDSYRDPIPVVDGLKVRIRSLEDEARALRDEIRSQREDAARMHDEIVRLKDALTNAHVPPGTAQFRQLEAKLMDVEARHKQREADLQILLDKTRSTASSEINSLRAKYAQIVQKKNEEINTFRAELDHMLRTIATINNVNSDRGVVYFSNVE